MVRSNAAGVRCSAASGRSTPGPIGRHDEMNEWYAANLPKSALEAKRILWFNYRNLIVHGYAHSKWANSTHFIYHLNQNETD